MKNALKLAAILSAAVLLGAGCTSSATVQGTPTGGTINTGVQGGAGTGY